jgi:hypothetical protein
VEYLARGFGYRGEAKMGKKEKGDYEDLEDYDEDDDETSDEDDDFAEKGLTPEDDET